MSMSVRDLIDVLKALYPSICIDAIINLSKFDNLEDVLAWVKDNRTELKNSVKAKTISVAVIPGAGFPFNSTPIISGKRI